MLNLVSHVLPRSERRGRARSMLCSRTRTAFLPCTCNSCIYHRNKRVSMSSPRGRQACNPRSNLEGPRIACCISGESRLCTKTRTKTHSGCTIPVAPALVLVMARALAWVVVRPALGRGSARKKVEPAWLELQRRWLPREQGRLNVKPLDRKTLYEI